MYLDYCRSLGFEEEPDYPYLRRMLRGAAAREGIAYDGVFDWMLRGQPPSPRWPQPAGANTAMAQGPSIAAALGYGMVPTSATGAVNLLDLSTVAAKGANNGSSRQVPAAMASGEVPWDAAQDSHMSVGDGRPAAQSARPASSAVPALQLLQGQGQLHGHGQGQPFVLQPRHREMVTVLDKQPQQPGQEAQPQQQLLAQQPGGSTACVPPGPQAALGSDALQSTGQETGGGGGGLMGGRGGAMSAAQPAPPHPSGGQQHDQQNQRQTQRPGTPSRPRGSPRNGAGGTPYTLAQQQPEGTARLNTLSRPGLDSKCDFSAQSSFDHGRHDGVLQTGAGSSTITTSNTGGALGAGRGRPARGSGHEGSGSNQGGPAGGGSQHKPGHPGVCVILASSPPGPSRSGPQLPLLSPQPQPQPASDTRILGKRPAPSMEWARTSLPRAFAAGTSAGVSMQLDEGDFSGGAAIGLPAPGDGEGLTHGPTELPDWPVRDGDVLAVTGTRPQYNSPPPPQPAVQYVLTSAGLAAIHPAVLAPTWRGKPSAGFMISSRARGPPPPAPMAAVPCPFLTAAPMDAPQPDAVTATLSTASNGTLASVSVGTSASAPTVAATGSGWLPATAAPASQVLPPLAAVWGMRCMPVAPYYPFAVSKTVASAPAPTAPEAPFVAQPAISALPASRVVTAAGSSRSSTSGVGAPRVRVRVRLNAPSDAAPAAPRAVSIVANAARALRTAAAAVPTAGDGGDVEVAVTTAAAISTAAKLSERAASPFGVVQLASPPSTAGGASLPNRAADQ